MPLVNITVLKDLLKSKLLQSVFISCVVLLFGCLLLWIDNSLKTPAGRLGTISVILGLLYTFHSFVSNKNREKHKDIMTSYDNIIERLEETSGAAHKRLQNDYSKSTQREDGIGDNYQPTSKSDTQKE